MDKSFHFWANENFEALEYTYYSVLPKYINKTCDKIFKKPSFQEWCEFLYNHSSVDFE